MGFTSASFNFSNTEKGMSLMLASRSNNTLSKNKFSIVQGIVKLFGSLNFHGNFLWRMALYSFVWMIVSWSSHFHLLEIISFKKFTYLDICSIVSIKYISIKYIFIWCYLKMFKNFWKFIFSTCFVLNIVEREYECIFRIYGLRIKLPCFLGNRAVLWLLGMLYLLYL